jgi:hypothetical protein
MSDNVQLPIGYPFYSRTKDVSAAQDGSLQRTLLFASLYPLDYAPGGMYQHSSLSGAMAAGLGAASSIYAFQWPSSSLLGIIRRVSIAAWTLGTGFTAGLAEFDMFVARDFTAQDTGGVSANMAGNSSKLRTSMATSSANIVHSSTAALALAHTNSRVDDPAPIGRWIVAAPTGTNTPFNATPVKLFEKLQGEHPLVLAQNEGFVILATVPATGLWSFVITPEWDEIPASPGF